jgi:hypothetical protein
MVCAVLAEDMVDEKTREKMVLAIEKAILSLGEPTYEDGMKKAVKLLEFVTNGARSAQTLDELRSALDACEPVSKSEEMLVLFAMRNLPSLLRACLKMAAKSAAIDFPALPAGRRKALTAQQAVDAVDYIWELTRKGAPMDAAKLRAGQKYGCSRRTIDRLCADRDSVPEDKPTIAEVINRLTQAE